MLSNVFAWIRIRFSNFSGFLWFLLRGYSGLSWEVGSGSGQYQTGSETLLITMFLDFSIPTQNRKMSEKSISTGLPGTWFPKWGYRFPKWGYRFPKWGYRFPEWGTLFPWEDELRGLGRLNIRLTNWIQELKKSCGFLAISKLEWNILKTWWVLEYTLKFI